MRSVYHVPFSHFLMAPVDTFLLLSTKSNYEFPINYNDLNFLN